MTTEKNQTKLTNYTQFQPICCLYLINLSLLQIEHVTCVHNN